jgi:hypothetical protein
MVTSILPIQVHSILPLPLTPHFESCSEAATFNLAAAPRSSIKNRRFLIATGSAGGNSPTANLRPGVLQRDEQRKIEITTRIQNEAKV